MSSNPLVPSFRLPSKIPSGVVHPTVKKAIENNVNGLVDVNQAIASIKSQVDALKTSAKSTATSTTTTVTVQSTQFSGLGTVNNQTGATVYTTQLSDNGALIVLSDASPITVTLNAVTQTPFFLFIVNLGTGLATLTPSAGATVNGGSSFPLPQNYTAICVLQNNTPGAWWATAIPVVPQTFNAVAHEFLESYDSVTGIFAAAQPTIADVSGLPTALALLAPLASPALSGTPTAPTASPGTNTTQISTTAFVEAAIASLAPIASPTFTGVVTQPAPSVLTAAATDTSATAGGATALPATPAIYLEISVNGTIYKFPGFAV